MAGTTSLQSGLSPDSDEGLLHTLSALPFSWAQVWNNMGNCWGTG